MVERDGAAPLGVFTYGNETKTLVVAYRDGNEWEPLLDTGYTSVPALLDAMEAEVIEHGLGVLTTTRGHLAALQQAHVALIEHHHVRGEILQAWTALEQDVDRFCEAKGLALAPGAFGPALMQLLESLTKEDAHVK